MSLSKEEYRLPVKMAASLLDIRTTVPHLDRTGRDSWRPAVASQSAPPARHQNPDPTLAKLPLPCARATKGSRVRIREGRGFPQENRVEDKPWGKYTPTL